MLSEIDRLHSLLFRRHRRTRSVEAHSSRPTCLAKHSKTSAWYTWDTSSSSSAPSLPPQRRRASPPPLRTLSLRNAVPCQTPVFEKKLFSMCTGEVLAHLDGLASKPTDVVLFGIEAHVCITQVMISLSQDLVLFPYFCYFVVASIGVGKVLPAAAGIFSLYPKLIASLSMVFAPCRVPVRCS